MPINQFVAYCSSLQLRASLSSRKWDRWSWVATQHWFFPLTSWVLAGFISKQQAHLAIWQKQTKSQSLREHKQLRVSPVSWNWYIYKHDLRQGSSSRIPTLGITNPKILMVYDHKLHLYLIFFIYWLTEREEGRERERNIDLLFHLFMISLVESCMCPGHGLNLQP